MSDRGQALVELALVLPVLLALALGLVLLGELGVVRLTLSHAAAEAARAVALTNDDDEARAAAVAGSAPLDRRRVVVAIEPPVIGRPADPRGSLVRVELAYPLDLPLGAFRSGPLLVRATAARRIEWTP